MFGYIRPYSAELRSCDKELYEAEYCGICREMRLGYGFAAAFSLSYDLVFFAEIGRAAEGGKAAASKRVCPVRPFERRLCASCAGKFGTGYAADCGIILSFAKLIDDLHDKALLPKLRALGLIPLMFPYYIKAKKKRPAAAAAVSDCMKAQRGIERTGTRSVDRLSEPTAAMLRAIMREMGGTDPDLRTALGDVGYMLGRFIYLCDALGDLEDDIASGDVNPFVPHGRVSDTAALRRRALNKAERSAGLTLWSLEQSYSRLPRDVRSEITDNIIYKGLHGVFEDLAAKKRQRSIKEGKV